MNAILTTIGSRGDIQPYIALGTELQKHFETVSIVTHPWAAPIISQYGLTHIPAGPDIDIHYEARQFVAHSKSKMEGMKYALNFIFDNLHKCHKDFLKAAENADVVIGHGIAGQLEAYITGKPYVTVSIETMGLQKQFWVTGNILKEALVFLGAKVGAAMFGGPYKKFLSDYDVSVKDIQSREPYLAIVPISKEIQPISNNWKKETVVTGYFYADTPQKFSPDEKLKQFLASGEKPVLITCGSMFHEKKESRRMLSEFIKALENSDSRAILIMADIDKDDKLLDNESVILAREVPYSWLLNQVSLVVHHFGFGTTAETLRAGIPSIPIPHIMDQQQRAKQISKMGFATKPINLKGEFSGHLAKAIKDANDDKAMKDACVALAEKIQQENGRAFARQKILSYLQ
ncbi:MAG: hypothetical protein C0593_10805 [Marinilabiliales bacterium]|nr:MAG: hypothetical protein C0593_10805 [Marinilabiliales bacterium]